MGPGNTMNNSDTFKNYRNTHSKLRRSTKRSFFNKAFGEVKHDAKKTWNLINTFTKTKKVNSNITELNPNPAEGGPNWPTSWFLDFNCAVTPNMNTWQPCKFIFSLISMENCFFGRVWPYFPKFSNGRPIRAPLGWFLRNR